MSDLVYCYHCGRHHPRDEMRRLESKGRKFWRCLKSIEAAAGPQAARDAFGRQTKERNRVYWQMCADARNMSRAARS